jgi:transposase
MKSTPVGIDIAKHVFQIHYVDEQSGKTISKQLSRAKLVNYFANRAPCLIGMEACGGAHHWAREFQKLGHEVKLMPGRYVKAFNPGNKNDAADACAIWRAVQQPCKGVAVKSEAQQAVLALHRMRTQLVKFRTMRSNSVRGLLSEYGEVMARGRRALDESMPEVLQRLGQRLPQAVVQMLKMQWQELARLDEQISELERQLSAWLRETPAVKRVAAIPGVGLLTATAVVASMGDPKAFRSGREFAAWLGLVPRQTGTGGKLRLLGISKRGDAYLRTLLIHGARSVLQHAKEPGAWVTQLRARRPLNVVTVALANKMARIIWALLAHGREYRGDYTSPTGT